MTEKAFRTLNREIISCRRCPRLVQYRETVPVRAVFAAQSCWRKPVPGFGDQNAWLLITGLAPSVEGGNRTGRIFTGDASARFLIPALYKAGLASQPTSESVDDGLQLLGCYLTAVVKCVPPHHRPTAEETRNCSSYYEQEHDLLKNLRCVLALGGFAFDAYVDFVNKKSQEKHRIQFAHGVSYSFEGLPTLYGSYHPSPQNTNTGKLTEKMLVELLKRIRRMHASVDRH